MSDYLCPFQLRKVARTMFRDPERCQDIYREYCHELVDTRTDKVVGIEWSRQPVASPKLRKRQALLNSTWGLNALGVI